MSFVGAEGCDGKIRPLDGRALPWWHAVAARTADRIGRADAQIAARFLQNCRHHEIAFHSMQEKCPRAHSAVVSMHVSGGCDSLAGCRLNSCRG
jgi:hypothetical protein